ncbi:hypothetical protein K466DRAFT_322107 [Polyporus arcularius HHB13444]|uniref:Uncharacterized protein n=1 Tax=Polyporus arcularius HHB13444 TaxID=1314778 RepID=A0A5C3NX45_9APHY|nr:hypothetical protein K466DRAFT_322107 [Polyporus arcularius HHB13444]
MAASSVQLQDLEVIYEADVAEEALLLHVASSYPRLESIRIHQYRVVGGSEALGVPLIEPETYHGHPHFSEDAAHSPSQPGLRDSLALWRIQRGTRKVALTSGVTQRRDARDVIGGRMSGPRGIVHSVPRQE